MIIWQTVPLMWYFLRDMFCPLNWCLKCDRFLPRWREMLFSTLAVSWSQHLHLSFSSHLHFPIPVLEYSGSSSWLSKSSPSSSWLSGEAPYPDVTYHLTLRRRPLFYGSLASMEYPNDRNDSVFNLILPCILITGIALMSFYMPSDSGEKVLLMTMMFWGSSLFFMRKKNNSSSLNINIASGDPGHHHSSFNDSVFDGGWDFQYFGQKFFPTRWARGNKDNNLGKDKTWINMRFARLQCLILSVRISTRWLGRVCRQLQRSFRW